MLLVDLVKEYYFYPSVHSWFYNFKMDCVICLGVASNPEQLPCCRKAFCGECLLEWRRMRNCCPHCIKPLGSQEHNQLTKMVQEEFDPNALMLEAQLTRLVERYHTLGQALKGRREECLAYRSLLPKAHLEIAEEQLLQLHCQIEIGSVAVGEGDKLTAATSLQAATELVNSIEGVLSGEGVQWEEEEEWSGDECFSEDEEEEEYAAYQSKLMSQQRRPVKNAGRRRN